MKKIQITIILLHFLLAIYAQEITEIKIWNSKNFDLEISYSTPWEIISAADESERVFIGLMNEKAKMAYSVEINMIPKMDSLSNQEYYEYTKDFILNQNMKNRLISEGFIDFNGEKYHQQVFEYNNKKWGSQKLYEIVKREKGSIIGINFMYPIETTGNTDNSIPIEIRTISENLNINE